MKRTVLYGAFLVGCLSLAACQQHKESKTSEPDLTGKVAETRYKTILCQYLLIQIIQRIIAGNASDYIPIH